MLNDLYRVVKQRSGRELALNSACRTPAHNTKVGGASKSKHLTTTPGGCMAVDIDCRDDSYRAVIIKAAIEIGFQRFLGLPMALFTSMPERSSGQVFGAMAQVQIGS